MPQEYEALANALKESGIPFAEYGWKTAPTGDYGTWGEEGDNVLRADNRSAEHATRYDLHYFTRDDTGAPKATIEAALDALPCAWTLDYVDFEEDSGYIHYEWIIEVL